MPYIFHVIKKLQYYVIPQVGVNMLLNQEETKINFISKLRMNTFRSLGVRLYEFILLLILWGASFLVFRIKASIYGIEYGKSLQIYGNVLVRGPGKIVIGNNVIMVSSSWYALSAPLSHGVRLRTFMPSRLSDNRIIIGDGVSLNGRAITARSTIISIGKNTMFAPDCILMDTDFHVPWPAVKRKLNPGFENDKPVTIGENVWVGARSIILKGVSIGDNSVIAAGSVVTRSIPANVLAAGNPAKVVKYYV